MLGIDVSKATLAVTLLHPVTRERRWEGVFPNTAKGVRQLLQRTPRTTPWVLEPTGNYSRTVAQQATAAQRHVLLAPPRKAKAFLSSIQTRAKTDRLDSHGLALYALSVPLQRYPLKSEAVDHLDQLLAARRGIAQALARLGQQRAELPYAADALLPALQALEAQRTSLDRRIAALTADTTAFPAVAALAAVPGIGPVTAAAVASCLQTKAFRHSDAFVAYIGLDIRVRDAGRRSGKRTLSKQGDPKLRRLLYLCAQANLRVADSPFRAQYQHELAKGLPKTAALCSVARKLARLCWSLARHGTTYRQERVNQQPPTSHALDTEP